MEQEATAKPREAGWSSAKQHGNAAPLFREAGSAKLPPPVTISPTLNPQHIPSRIDPFLVVHNPLRIQSFTPCHTLNTLPPSNKLSTPGIQEACFIHVCLLRNCSTVSDCEVIICLCWEEGERERSREKKVMLFLSFRHPCRSWLGLFPFASMCSSQRLLL